MKVNVLHVEQCPNVKPLMEELQELLAGRDDVAVTTRLVRSDDEARQLGFHGSPTILIDGHDPFPSAAETVGISCRRYQTDEGILGLPSRSQLEEALRAPS